MQESEVQSLGWEDPLEEGMATHSRNLAWRIPQTEEPGRLWSLRLQRVGHTWSDLACTLASCHMLFSEKQDGSLRDLQIPSALWLKWYVLDADWKFFEKVSHCITLHWNITQPRRGLIYWTMLQHGWTSTRTRSQMQMIMCSVIPFIGNVQKQVIPQSQKAN